MLLYKPKKSQVSMGNRFLLTVTVLCSPGPIRFVVNENELVANVINTTLKAFAREGRLPVLGTDIDGFMLYCPVLGTEALSPWETIGTSGARNFMLYKKPENGEEKASSLTKKRDGSWKTWFNKPTSLKISKTISSH